MTSSPRVAARILTADFACLGHWVAAAIRAGADLVHMDVMDHDWTPDLTLGPRVCRALRNVTRARLEVHLLVKPVDEFVPAYADAGADVITFHPEASEHVARSVALVRAHGCQVGLAVNPTGPQAIDDALLEAVDVVLITPVSPGFDGERFVPSALHAIRSLRARVSALGCEVSIAVEGGVDMDNAAELLTAGADTLVVGSSLCGSNEHAGAIAALKAMASPRSRGPLGMSHQDGRRRRTIHQTV